MRVMRWLAIALLLGAAAAGAAETVNRVAAVVDDQVITLREVETVAAPMIAELAKRRSDLSPEEQRQQVADIKQRVLQNLIEQKLIETEVRRLGIQVTDQEVDAYIDRVKQANNYTDETLRLALEQQGVKMQEFRERMKTEIMREQYVSFRMRDKLRVRDEDVQAYYDQHKSEFAAEPVARIAEIRLNAPPDASEAALQVVFAKANEVYDKLQAGGDFAALAKASSQGPTASDGGVLGEFKIDSELQPTYRKAVAPLSPGQCSTVYRDRNGFIIIKLLERKPGGALPLDKVKDKIGMILRKQQADAEMNRLGAELRKKSFVDVKVNFSQAQ